MADGRVEAIHLAGAAGEPMRAVPAALAIPGVGLEGDRYASRTGHWSAIRRSGDELTLVEAEVVTSLAAHGLALEPGATRRNVTTSGVRLDELIGQTFTLGEVTCRGIRRCEPCSWLEELVGLPVLAPLVHRGGIRVEIIGGGVIRVGDSVAAIEAIEAAQPPTG